jgi:ubiquinone/menaquinone biosynthesis C-methylase UbiE
MKRSPYDTEHEVEGFHWWFAVRRKLLATLLFSFKFHSESLAVDIGCGTVSNLKILKSAGFSVTGLDRSIYALTLHRKKFKFPLINGDLTELPIRSKSVGLIVAMDILEHIEDDVAGIHELYRVLNDGGSLILTVPAFNFLWGIQDDVTGHKRRYSKKEILDKLKRGGFEILKSSYFNFFLFIPILIGRRLMHIFRLKVESENRINFPMLNSLLKAIFSIEPHVLRYFSFPFGVSILCIAKKR